MRRIGFVDILFSADRWGMKAFKAFDFLVGGLLAWALPRRPVRGVTAAPGRVLIIRPGGVGDAIFLLPILRALKIRGFSIDILCETRNAGVFHAQGDLFHAVYCYDNFMEFLAVFRTTYDVIVDTEQWHYLSAITSYLCSGISIGFATRPLRRKLFHLPIMYKPDAYELENFKDLFSCLLPGLDFRIEGSFVVGDALADRVDIEGSFMVIALGASIALRRLGRDQALFFVREAHIQGLSVVLIGGKDVASFAAGIAQMPSEGKVINLAGQLTLSQTASLISRAVRFAGPDSGIMHLACAVGTPVTTIFGPGNRLKWGPRGPKDKVLFKNMPCSPCTFFGYTFQEACHGKADCLMFSDKDMKRVGIG